MLAIVYSVCAFTNYNDDCWKLYHNDINLLRYDFFIIPDC